MTKWPGGACIHTLLHNYKPTSCPDGIDIDKDGNPALFQLKYRTCLYFHDLNQGSTNRTGFECVYIKKYFLLYKQKKFYKN